MGFWIAAAVVFGLPACGAAYCLVQERHNRTEKTAYYIGRELRHGAEWIKTILHAGRRERRPLPPPSPRRRGGQERDLSSAAVDGKI